jgi:hypothetical protein
MRNFGSELGDIKKGYKFQMGQFGKFADQWGFLDPGGYLKGILASQGRLSPEELRDVSQYSRTQGQSQYGFGDSRQAGAFANEVLNRSNARWQRYQQASQTGLQQLLSNVGAYTGLTNPILSYLSNLFGGNLQASIAQSQINQQGAIANDQKQLGAIKTGLEGAGSIIGGIAMSDERLKTKIKDVGISIPEGIPLKKFEYRTRPGVQFIGVMAQDVLKIRPDLVISDPVSGTKMVHSSLAPIQISRSRKKEE